MALMLAVLINNEKKNCRSGAWLQVLVRSLAKPYWMETTSACEAWLSVKRHKMEVK